MKKNNLYQGTLDLLILQAIKTKARHGWGISLWLEKTSLGHFSVPQGSLYPALHRLESQGLLKAQWRETEEGRKAKFYSLTQRGLKALADSQSRWDNYSAAVAMVMKAGSQA